MGSASAWYSYTPLVLFFNLQLISSCLLSAFYVVERSVWGSMSYQPTRLATPQPTTECGFLFHLLPAPGPCVASNYGVGHSCVSNTPSAYGSSILTLSFSQPSKHPFSLLIPESSALASSSTYWVCSVCKPHFLCME